VSFSDLVAQLVGKLAGVKRSRIYSGALLHVFGECSAHGKQCRLSVYALATRRPMSRFEILQDERVDELLPNQSLKLRSRLQRFFVENDGVVETIQASNNLKATLQFI
jgi:hypothetical protein